MIKMITEIEQAALNDFGIKIHRITWWEVNKFQMGYIEENGHVEKLRVLINSFSEKSRKMSYTSHCKNRANLNCVGLNFDNLPEAQQLEIHNSLLGWNSEIGILEGLNKYRKWLNKINHTG